MNILVTGGAGFIGSNFCNMYAGWCNKMIVLDKLTYAADEKYLNCKHSFVMGDICDRVAVGMILRTQKIDTIVHFAAESHVDRSIQSADKFVTTNINGTFTLIDEFNRHRHSVDSPRFIHVSTDEVYGVAYGTSSFTETSPYAPNSPYAASKAASDLLVRSYVQTHNFPAIITHCSNNFGPHQASEKFIPTVVKSLVRRLPIPIYGTGKQVRDWIHVSDHCRALWSVLTGGRIGDTYNIGGNCEIANIDLVLKLCDLYDSEHTVDSSQSLITHVKDRAAHDFRYSVNTHKITSELGWQASKGTEKLFADTVKYYTKRFTENLA